MNCCTPTGYRTIFGAKTVQRDARRYRRKGLTGSAGWLRNALSEDGVTERSVLEVGGGIDVWMMKRIADHALGEFPERGRVVPATRG